MTRLILIMACLLAEILLVARPVLAADRGVVLIAHASVHRLDLPTVRRIYTGKTVEVDGVRVVPVNLSAGPVRQRFLADFLDTEEDQYVGYWTVRRYVGKGTPPIELRQVSDVIEFVSRTPGAIGYLEEPDVPKGANVVLRR
jgi:hypothetical protein